MEKKHWLLFAAILFSALLLRLWQAPMRGHIHDIDQFKIWTQTAVSTNPLAIYSTTTANYPPLGLLPLFVMGYLYRAIFSPDFDTASTTLTALLKVPGITADLLTAVILFRYLSRHHSRRWAFTGLAAYALNPAIIYNTAWWGQLESLVTLPMLLSVISLSDGRIRWAWIWLAVAFLVKPQAAVLLPVILIGSIHASDWHRLVKGVAAAVLTTLALLLPFILAGQLPALVAQIRASAGNQLFLTMNAHNFWYFITAGQGSFAAREGAPIFDNHPLIGPFTGWQIGLVLYLLYTLLIAFQYKITRLQPVAFTTNYQSTNQPITNQPINPNTTAPLFRAAAALVIGFYMLPAEAHERYLFPALAFLVVLLPGKRPYRLIYLLFSTTFLLNLLWVDSAVPLPTFEQTLPAAIPLAALNIILLIWFTANPYPQPPNSL